MGRLQTYDVVATDDPTILVAAYTECYRKLFPDAPELDKPMQSTFVPWIPDGWHWAIPSHAGDRLIAAGRERRFRIDVEDRRPPAGCVREDINMNNASESVRRFADTISWHRRGLIVCGSLERRKELIYQILWLLKPIDNTMIGYDSLAACRRAGRDLERKYNHLPLIPDQSRRDRKDFTSSRHAIPRLILTPITHEWWERSNLGRTYRLAADLRALNDRIRVYTMFISSLEATYGFLDRRQKLKPEERAALVRTFGQVIYEE